MPKISELPVAAALSGAELLPADQAGTTFSITTSQLAALSSKNFSGLTGEVTSPFGSLVTTINKSINPVWLGTHTFGDGIVVTFGNTPPALNNPNIVAQFMGIPGANSSGIQVDGFGAAPIVLARRANGTPAAPSAVKNGDGLGIFSTPAYDGSVWGPGVRFQGIATADWTPSAHSSAAVISAASAAGGGANPVAYFYGSGGASIGPTLLDPGAGNLIASGIAVGSPTGGSISGGVNAKAFYIDGTLFTGGGTAAPRRQRFVTTSPIVVQMNDDIINCKIPAAAACSLPLASTHSGVPLTFKDLGQATANHITLTAAAGDTIDGLLTYVISNNYGWVTLMPFSDGTNTGWMVL
jgi:hypothetical protein